MPHRGAGERRHEEVCVGVPVKEILKADGGNQAEAPMRMLQVFKSESLDRQGRGHGAGKN